MCDLTIVTTAINRPEIWKQSWDSLKANSNISRFNVQHLVSVDCLEHTNNSEQSLDITRATIQDSQLTNDRYYYVINQVPKGPAIAIKTLASYIDSPVVFFLEDDWLCDRDRYMKKTLDFDRYIKNLERVTYQTLTTRYGRASLNPFLARTSEFQLVAEQLVQHLDAEVQMIELAKKAHWTFSKASGKYFYDLGRAWREKQQIEKTSSNKIGVDYESQRQQRRIPRVRKPRNG